MRLYRISHNLHNPPGWVHTCYNCFKQYDKMNVIDDLVFCDDCFGSKSIIKMLLKKAKQNEGIAA